MNSYLVNRVKDEVIIDGRWEKYPWFGIKPLTLAYHMGVIPKHFPGVKVKLAYDFEKIYVIFQVEDRYVCAREKSYQAQVNKDSCVEFFFTPGEDLSAGYFNLELNCGGTALFHHQIGRDKQDVAVKKADFDNIMVAHSLPKIIDTEITDSVTWVVEYGLPFSILVKYASLTQPSPGVSWRANFYKCADESSHPHWLTWSPVGLEFPDFHTPDFFGSLLFG